MVSQPGRRPAAESAAVQRWDPQISPGGFLTLATVRPLAAEWSPRWGPDGLVACAGTIGPLFPPTGPISAQAAVAQAGEPLIRKLDGPTRASVLAALVALVILGVALILLTWLGARFVRRLGTRPPQRPPTLPLDDWARKPLVGGGVVEEPSDDGPAAAGGEKGEGEGEGEGEQTHG